MLQQKKRHNKKVGHPLKGCQSFHMIAVDPQGNFYTKVVLDIDQELEKMIFLNQVSVDDVSQEIINECVDEDDVDDSEEDVDNDVLLHPMVYEVVKPGSYVGLRPSPNGMELFYVVKILGKNIATEQEIDNCRHVIVPGEQYFTVVYLDYKTETRKYVKFELPKGKKCTNIYVHMGEVFAPNIEMGEVFATNIEMKEDLTMDIDEYRSLCNELY